MNCTLRFGNCFLTVRLADVPALLPFATLGGTHKRQLTKPTVQFILSLSIDSSLYLHLQQRLQHLEPAVFCKCSMVRGPPATAETAVLSLSRPALARTSARSSSQMSRGRFLKSTQWELDRNIVGEAVFVCLALSYMIQVVTIPFEDSRFTTGSLSNSNSFQPYYYFLEDVGLLRSRST